MSDFWSFVFSPAGVLLYAGFWAFKLLAGAWLIARFVACLPLGARGWAETKLIRVRVMRAKGPLG